MPTQSMLIRLPEDVASRLKAAVPARKRNKFIADLVASAVTRHEEELAKIASVVTEEEMRNPRLKREMNDWEATVGDGIEVHHSSGSLRSMTSLRPSWLR